MAVSRRIRKVARDVATSRSPFRSIGQVVAATLAYGAVSSTIPAVLAPGRGLWAGVNAFVSPIESGVTSLLGLLSVYWRTAWSSTLDLHVFQLPYAVGIVLLTLFGVSLVVDEWRES
jgi:hypothetical protein